MALAVILPARKLQTFGDQRDVVGSKNGLNDRSLPQGAFTRARNRGIRATRIGFTSDPISNGKQRSGIAGFGFRAREERCGERVFAQRRSVGQVPKQMIDGGVERLLWVGVRQLLDLAIGTREFES